MTPPPEPVTDPLAGLRAYHLPDTPGWWPPAPGWWLLAGLLLLGSLLAAWWALRRRRRRAAALAALRELALMQAAARARGDHAAFVRGLSRLLRRYALVAFPGRPVAALTGDAWLAFLDANGGGGRFLHGHGQVLADAPYRPAVEVAVDRLAELARDWILANREVRQ